MDHNDEHYILLLLADGNLPTGAPPSTQPPRRSSWWIPALVAGHAPSHAPPFTRARRRPHQTEHGEQGSLCARRAHRPLAVYARMLRTEYASQLVLAVRAPSDDQVTIALVSRTRVLTRPPPYRRRLHALHNSCAPAAFVHVERRRPRLREGASSTRASTRQRLNGSRSAAATAARAKKGPTLHQLRRRPRMTEGTRAAHSLLEPALKHEACRVTRFEVSVARSSLFRAHIRD